MERVLIIKLSALGDIVQAEGAMHDIRLHHADAEITVLTTPPYERYMNLCPWVDKVIIDKRASWFNVSSVLALRNQLRRCNFNMVYDLQQVDRTRMYHRLFLSANTWMGDTKGSTYFRRRPKNQSAAGHFDRHLTLAGVKTSHTLNCDISWMAEDVSTILRDFNLPNRFIALIPGSSSVHPEKRWPFFIELAKKLIATGILPVTIPGPDEMDLCQNFPGQMLTLNNSFLDYFQLSGVLKKTIFTIGNDTGPTHLAAHLRDEGLALFSGHTTAQSTGIQHTKFKWIEVQDLRSLPLATVWNQVKQQLGL